MFYVVGLSVFIAVAGVRVHSRLDRSVTKPSDDARATAIAVEHVGVRFRRRRRARQMAAKSSGRSRTSPSMSAVGSLSASSGAMRRKVNTPSGSGGIMKPDRGTIQYHDVRRVSLLALNVGFIIELSGRENAILSGRMLG